MLAYKAATNEILAIECKSYLDSTGVQFVDGRLEPEDRYKLFTDPTLREVVFTRLAQQLGEKGACTGNPRVRLCSAVGKIANRTDRNAMQQHFEQNGAAHGRPMDSR